MTRFTSNWWAVAVLATVGLFDAASAQPPKPLPPPPDPLEVAKARQQVADQKAEANVLQTLENADRLAKGNLTAKATQTLRTAKQDLQLAIGISDAARTRLTALIDAKLAAIEGKPLNPPAGIKLDPKADEVKAAQKEAVAKQLAELKDVRDGIKKIEQYQAAGKTAETNAEIARLAKAYPHNPSVVMLGYSDTMKNRLADAQAHYAAMSDRWVKNQQNINKSALPAIMDMEFPADWKEKSERRLRSQTIELTAQEKKIIEALDKPISINFAERPVEEALQDLSNTLDVPLHIEKKSLEDLGLDLKKGVTLQGKGLSGRTVLRAVLATQGLTFVVKDEAIQVVTVDRARTLLTTRVYYLGDLAAGGPFSDLRFGPIINEQQRQANVAALVEIIKKIDPLSWSDANGPGTITFHAPSMAVIVRNSAEVHHSLGSAFYGRRK